MRNVDRILLATDFMPASENAARVAVGIAADGRAELHVLTVHIINGAMPDADPTLYEEDKKQLDDYDTGSDLKMIKTIERGVTAAPIIVGYAREHKIDLIAVGTHSRQGIARFFLGSVAAEVVRTAPMSVLVAGPGHTTVPKDYKCIVAPVDFSQPSLAALREAAGIADNHGARLVAIHVVDTAVLPLYTEAHADTVIGQARHALAGFVETANVPVPVEPFVTSGAVHTRIAELAKERAADLIVMGASGSGAVERLLLGSATSRVLRMAPCPVFVHRGERGGAL